MQRTVLAIVGALLTAVGGWFSFVPGYPYDVGAIMFRSGLVIAALALALPQLRQFFAWFPPWLLACGAVGGGMIVYRPQLAVYVVPILAAMWFFGPRMAKKSPKPGGEKPKTSSRATRG